MGEILFSLLALFVQLEAPEHPWMAEAWAEVDSVGSLNECAAAGHEVDVPAGETLRGYHVHTAWDVAGVVTRTENVICLSPQDDLYGFWFTFVHELAHVYQYERMADREARVWESRLTGCTWNEVMADVFAYTVLGWESPFADTVFYPREHHLCRLGDTPPDYMVEYVGRQARARAETVETVFPWASWIRGVLTS